MKMTEEAMTFLEEHIPELAETAIKQAYWRALASGSSVLEVENDELVEVFPDGTRKFIKKVKPSMKIPPGTRLIIR